MPPETNGARRWLRLAPLALLLACIPSEHDAGPDAAAAVRADSVARALQDSINRARPGYVVDSILPLDEELRRFRAGIPVAPPSLAGGASSREALARAFVSALATGDSTALRRMALTRAEFAYLVYPSSPYTKPPYRQAPGLVWIQVAMASAAGYTRLIDRLSGQPFLYRGLSCDPKPDVQGENRIWRRCALKVSTPPGEVVTLRLFGDIIERAGAFKFVSFTNDM